MNFNKTLFDILNLMGPKSAQFDSAVAGASSDTGKVWLLILFYSVCSLQWGSL